MKKKILAMVMAVVMMIGVVPVVTVTTGEESTGENKFFATIEPPAENSIPISTRAELEAIIEDLEGSFHLTADIDLSGEQWTPIANFDGIFDGQGYVISNLRVTGNRSSAGLFISNHENSVIKNVGLENTFIEIHSLSGSPTAGGISATNGGMIVNCYNTGTVRVYAGSSTTGSITTTTNSAGSTAGGIVGRNDTYRDNEFRRGVVRECFNNANVTAWTIAVSSASAWSGGIVGSNPGSVENCYNTGKIEARGTATSNSAPRTQASSGGIVGLNSSNGTINNSYNVGRVRSSSNNFWSMSMTNLDSGGICGTNNVNAGAITNCYWNSEVTGSFEFSGFISSSGKGIGYGSGSAIARTAEEMKQQSTFEGFDFDAVWVVNENINNGFPILQAFEKKFCNPCGQLKCVCVYCDICEELENECICVYCDVCKELKNECVCPCSCGECEECKPDEPTDIPTDIPTDEPTIPTDMPTDIPTDIPTDEPPTFKLGHVTGGDKIGIADALEVLKHLAGISTLTGNSFEAALITPQSQSARRISIGDVLEILKHLAGISKIG